METATRSGAGRLMWIITALWVCLSNLVFADIVLKQLLAVRTLHRLLGTPVPRNQYLVPVSIMSVLLLGVALEFADSSAAAFVNGGFFLLVSAYATVALVYGWNEPEAQNFGWSLGIPSLFVLVLDVALYAGKKRLRSA